MNNGIDENPAIQQRFAEVFARLPEQDIEHFYAHYQLWLLRRRVPLIEEQIESLQEHLAQNQQLIQSLQPSAVALAVLARLQSNGMSNIDVLDQMLERGEDWLDRMMQRLDYCEQVEDFIQGDYTQWCINSLDGAYDWMDTLLGSTKEAETPQEPGGAEAEATEELLLQKLSQEDEESTPDVTLKQPAINPELVESSESAAGAQETTEQEEIPLSVAEQFLMAGANSAEEAESSESLTEIEQPPELANWTDLEAPEERPAPWYSVNLAGNAPSETAQADAMNDWIEVLHADTVSAPETGETATPASSAHEPATSEPAAHETPSTEQAENIPPEPAEISAEEPETREPESDETLNEAEIDLAGNERPGVEEGAAAPASPPAPDETEAEAQNEPRAVETEVSEETRQDEIELVENVEEATQAPGEIEQTEDEIAQPIEESAATPEMSEPGHVAEAMLATTEEETRAEFARFHELSSGETELMAAETTESQGAERTLAAGTELSGNEAGETQEAEAAPTAEAELEEIALAAEPVRSEVGEAQEAGVDLEAQAQSTEAETAATSVEVQETEAEMTVSQEAQSAETEKMVIITEAQEAATEAQSHEVEEAAIVNDLLSSEEEQRPWYEYLEADEQADLALQNQIEEDDTTLPMALRDIQRAREAQIRAGQADAAQNELEASPGSASEFATEAAESSEPARGEVNEPSAVEEQKVARPEPLEMAIEERSAPETSEAATSLYQAAPVTHTAPQPQSEEPPKKRGFWQRLFGWMRKK